MNIREPNPTIEVKSINNFDFIYFTFRGKLTENDAKNAIVNWKNQLEKRHTMQPHIWNCMQMTGYEPMARAHWQKAIKELKGKISKIWLISDSSIIIAGAKILSLFTSFDIITVRSEEDFLLMHQVNPI
jgi:hypothetical protein